MESSLGLVEVQISTVFLLMNLQHTPATIQIPNTASLCPGTQL